MARPPIRLSTYFGRMPSGMIIPDGIRPKYVDNLIGGLAMNLSGPYLLKLGFHIFVVIVGGLILSGAVNTSIIGANGILNRVAEDRVLVPSFREPHKRYGTTFRMINTITMLQTATIIYSRADMPILAQPYTSPFLPTSSLNPLQPTFYHFPPP